jgi:predicted pyridoxine 5'-phosphate oxidase superfamily flavin-nucleotide-binding protein
MVTKAERSEGDNPMRQYASDIAFTPSVKAIQSRKGSRSAYSKVEKGRGWQTKVTSELTVFLSELDMFYLGTANAEGQPYIQYRGGSPGFLKVIDDKTLGFADFAGNKQYITLGNLSENPKAFIFLMDYAHSRRVKLWGSAHAVEDDPTLLDQLRDPSYPGEVERAILFTIEAWDVNCPQHIHKRFSQATVDSAVKQLRSQVQELQAKLDKLENKESHS